ncbi:MAG TPA: aldo/keto reductase [candidate division Zixibacteria bacterium]|nr:aldo/keto reductase [candidate division Zixibacteria bacterium]
MRYRSVGKTDLRISEIGFGCGNNAVLMVKASYDEQMRAVRHALDCGINYFDTAFAYGLGKSEGNLGRILRELGAPAVVSTKIRLGPEALGDVKAATAQAVDGALERLGRDRIDVIQLHTRVTSKGGTAGRFSLTPADVLGPNGVIEAFKAARDKGKVRYFGFSGLGDPGALCELVDSGEFHAFQAYYNLLNPSAGQPVPEGFSALDYRGIIDRAAAKGMGAFVIRVLAAGALTSDPSAGGGSSPEPLSPGSDYRLDCERAEKVREALGVDPGSLAGAAIRFALMKPEVSSVLVGFSNTGHIDQAVACSGAAGLSAEQLARLRELWRTDFGRLADG